MISALGLRVYKERRRLAFVAILAFFAGVLFYLPAPIYIGGVHISLITGAIYASVVGVAAVFVCLFLPRMRFMIEAVAIARLGLAFFVLWNPGVGYQILANPLATAFVVVTGGFIISRMLHGRILSDGKRTPFWPTGTRQPARIAAQPWQHRFLTWLDDTAPLPA